MPRVCILGSFTGRNAGDAAILENIVRDLAAAIPGVRCEVLTINPRFIRETYPDLPLEPVATLPWNLSIKSLGLPLLLSVWRCDAVIVTQAILFDREWWNPLYNYLSTLLAGLPLARRLGRVVYHYGCGVGPIYTPGGRRAVRYLIDLADGISLREEASVSIMRELGCAATPSLAADAALNQRFPEGTGARAEALLESRIGHGPYAAVNLNAYIDDWTGRKGEGRLTEEGFCREMAAVVQTITDTWGWGVVLISTHHMDDRILETVERLADRHGRVLLLRNREYDHRFLMAAMHASELMIGMRLHCQILAAAAGTPCVALNYAPKVRHFMEMTGLGEYVVDFENFSAARVLERASYLRNHLGPVRVALRSRVAELRERAKIPARELAALLAARRF